MDTAVKQKRKSDNVGIYLEGSTRLRSFGDDEDPLVSRKRVIIRASQGYDILCDLRTKGSTKEATRGSTYASPTAQVKHMLNVPC